MPEPDVPEPDELTNDEIISRLDEVLGDLDDDAPPDLDIPDEDEAPPEDVWSAVEDAVRPDVPLPDTEADAVPPEETWSDIEDVSRPDLEVEALLEPTPEDPWVPVDYGAMVEAEPVKRTLEDRGFRLPRTPGPALLQPPRTLPWRGTVDVLDPELPALVCVADATSTGSRLLVAAWSWVDESAGDRLRFRLSDDGPELDIAPSTPHEAVLETTVRILDQELRVRLHLEAVRDERGVVLGRDVLAGRFVVDPARQDWSDEP
jgi:hypothetical protein